MSPLRCAALLDLLQVRARPAGKILGLPQQERRGAEHHGHLVVDLVGDPAGEPPDGVHPLGLLQPLLEPAAFGDVAEEDADAAVGRGKVVQLVPALVRGIPALERALDPLGHDPAVLALELGSQEIGPQLPDGAPDDGLGHQALGRQQLGTPAVEVADAPVGIHAEVAVAGALEDGTGALMCGLYLVQRVSRPRRLVLRAQGFLLRLGRRLLGLDRGLLGYRLLPPRFLGFSLRLGQGQQARLTQPGHAGADDEEQGDTGDVGGVAEIQARAMGEQRLGEHRSQHRRQHGRVEAGQRGGDEDRREIGEELQARAEDRLDRHPEQGGTRERHDGDGVGLPGLVRPGRTRRKGWMAHAPPG